MAWSPCPLKRFPGARQPDHQLPACSHRFQIMAPRATRVSFTPTTTRETRHVHRTHHLSSRGCPPHRYSRYTLDISAARSHCSVSNSSLLAFSLSHRPFFLYSFFFFLSPLFANRQFLSRRGKRAYLFLSPCFS